MPNLSNPRSVRRRPWHRHVAAAAVTTAFATTIALAPLATATAADTYAQTRHPVVLVHGLFGFDQVAAVDYFYAIPRALRSGGATVYTPSVSAANSNEARGEQLLQTLRALKAAHGHEKFNLVGHSQGGATARYVAAVAPELVASVTTVGAPHGGSKVADALGTLVDVPFLGPTLIALVNGFASVVSTVSGSPALPQNALAALRSLNTAGAQDFNRRFPQGAPATSCGSGAAKVNNVAYYSAGGTSVHTNLFDIGDPVLGLGALSYGFEANDGLVGRCSSHWGAVIRDDYAWNHLDQANQLFGLRGLFSQDPVAFYRAQANRLKNAGL
jgi:triacylglycerol lipase